MQHTSEPFVQRDAIQFARFARFPWTGSVHAQGKHLQSKDCLEEIKRNQWKCDRQLVGVCPADAAKRDHAFAAMMRPKSFNAEFLRKGNHSVLSRTAPLSAHIHKRSVF